MHAINAFFGRPAITAAKFNEYVATFDKEMARRYGKGVSSASFDLVHADQNNLVGYILKKCGYYVRYLPMYQQTRDVSDMDGSFLFAFNGNHIWGVRKHDSRWYKVDSIGGVTPIGNFKQYLCQPNIGFMVPVKMMPELNRHVDAILRIFKQENVRSKEGVKAYLHRLKEKKQLLEDLEIHMGVSIDIFDARASSTAWNAAFIPIYNLIDLHKQFTVDFVSSKYSIDVLEQYVPEIVFSLLILVRGRDAITGGEDEFIR
jgi:hypothetical protein